MPSANEILPTTVLPIGLTLLLLLLALLTRRRWPLLLAFALLYAASTPLVGQALMRSVAGDQEHGSLAAGVAAEADAIVVLSSRRPVAPSADGGVVSEWTVADRFLAGVALARAEAAPWLVYTGGWSPAAPSAPLEGDANREDAVALFERQGLRVTPYPVDLRVDAARIVTLQALLPSARALSNTETALREWLGRAVYRVGWSRRCSRRTSSWPNSLRHATMSLGTRFWRGRDALKWSGSAKASLSPYRCSAGRGTPAPSSPARVDVALTHSDAPINRARAQPANTDGHGGGVLERNPVACDRGP